MFPLYPTQPKQPPSPQASRRIATIIWWAFLGSLPVYALLIHLVHTSPMAEDARRLLLPLRALAGFDFLASLFYPRWMERTANKRLATWLTPESVPSEEDLHAAFYQNALLTVVVMGALGACIAIYGALLGFMGAPPRIWAPFFAVSIVHMVWQKAKHSSYFDRADQRAREISAGYTGGEP